MFRLLIANGCSYTRGAELADPVRQSWPSVLAGRLGVEVVNLGCDGGSNRRVVRTTVACLDRICAERSVRPEETLVLCLWTGITRDEYYRDDATDPGRRPDLPDEQHWHRLGRWRIAEGDRASEAYFRWLWTEEGALADFLLDWALLDSYLSRRGVVSRYGFAWSTVPARLPAAADPVAGLIDHASCLGGFPPAKGTSFRELTTGRFSFGPRTHPLAPAHARFAAVLADWLGAAG